MGSCGKYLDEIVLRAVGLGLVMKTGGLPAFSVPPARTPASPLGKTLVYRVISSEGGEAVLYGGGFKKRSVSGRCLL